jgi:hypothetical protein
MWWRRRRSGRRSGRISTAGERESAREINE